jgi:hypothetical protein
MTPYEGLTTEQLRAISPASRAKLEAIDPRFAEAVRKLKEQETREAIEQIVCRATGRSDYATK